MADNTKSPCLVLIDVQKGWDIRRKSERNNLGAEDKLMALLTHYRSKKWPVVHVQHLSTEKDSPLRPERPGSNFKEGFEPLAQEAWFKKSVNSSFIGTDLETFLRNQSIDELALCGFTTDHCVSTTARMGANLGFKISVIEDATVTFQRQSYDGTEYSAEFMHKTALASLHEEFAKIVMSSHLLGR